MLSSRRGVNCPAPCVQEENDFERCIWERVTPFFDRVVQENAVGAYAQSESELPANMERFGFREVSSRYVVLSLTPDDPACSPEMARALFEAGRSAALDNIDSLRQLPGQPVTSAEADEMKRQTNRRFATRLAQYEAGQKQWDTETILLQVVRGVK